MARLDHDSRVDPRQWVQEQRKIDELIVESFGQWLPCPHAPVYAMEAK
jgi:hypothetical protein